MTSAGEQHARPPEAALYIASIAVELARIAKHHHLDMLAYLLEMARMEAEQVSRSWPNQSNGGPD
jgi:hypothetical protein